VRRGYGRVYTEGDFIMKGSFLEAQRDARESDRGLWGCSTGAASSTDTDTDTDGTQQKDMDCDGFETQAEAQEFHGMYTGHELDGNGDGIACEALS